MKITPKELQALLAWALKYNKTARIEGDHVIVNGGFDCSHNNLTSLPESIGNMRVSGGFDCSHNNLTSLPENIGDMKVGLYFSCSHNKITFLPESITNMKINGYFYCYDNNLLSLPKSISNMKIRGHFCCSNNPLPKNHLRPQELVEGIYDDYTFLDGILTDIISTKTLDGKKVIKHSFGYVVSDGICHAHGEDLRTALLDLHFKTSKRDLKKYKSLDLNEKRSLKDLYEIYRNITGACSFGTNQWMESNKDFVKKVETEDASIHEVMEKTKGEYGNDKLMKFFS